jgi:hypothetical protein
MRNDGLLFIATASGVTQANTQISQLTFPGTQSAQSLTFILCIVAGAISPDMAFPIPAKTSVFNANTARNTICKICL